jgi:hypothetical protein
VIRVVGHELTNTTEGATMKKVCITIGIAVICGAAGATAQSTAAKGQGEGNTTAANGVVTVTGCVAQSPDGKGYMLNDAIMAPLPTGKPGSDAAVTGAAGDKTVLSYVLDGGEIKNHVGHKVQITGTKTAQKVGKADKASDPAKMDTGTMAMDHKDVGGTLKVKSLKMVAASCG